jgi:type VI secretion system secreted protein Hcp
MAVGAFLRLVGESQGPIQGSVTQKGREGLIEVASWSWGAEGNFVGGMATGQQTASEFHLSKRRDRSTPKLLNAFANNEELTTWTLDLYDTSFQGVEALTTKIELANVLVASFRQAGVDTGASGAPDHDEVTFVFQEITVTWADGNIVGSFET